MDRLQAMSVFVRVVETGSFSQGAQQIGVGQPAISKTIAQLEERLQVRCSFDQPMGCRRQMPASGFTSERSPRSRKLTKQSLRQRA